MQNWGTMTKIHRCSTTVLGTAQWFHAITGFEQSIGIFTLVFQAHTGVLPPQPICLKNMLHINACLLQLLPMQVCYIFINVCVKI